MGAPKQQQEPEAPSTSAAAALGGAKVRRVFGVMRLACQPLRPQPARSFSQPWASPCPSPLSHNNYTTQYAPAAAPPPVQGLAVQGVPVPASTVPCACTAGWWAIGAVCGGSAGCWLVWSSCSCFIQLLPEWQLWWPTSALSKAAP